MFECGSGGVCDYLCVNVFVCVCAFICGSLCFSNTFMFKHFFKQYIKTVSNYKNQKDIKFEMKKRDIFCSFLCDPE